MSGDNFHEGIAKAREMVANTITDMGIWRSVVENIVIMDASEEDKILLLLEAIPDIGVILSQLSFCKSKGLITEQEYKSMVKLSMLSIRKDKKCLEFNPTRMGKFTNGA